MTDRPIMFNAEMVRAILEGRKTQTRRPIKPQPLEGISLEAGSVNMYVFGRIFSNSPQLQRCPYGKPGDRLWVRETRAKNYPAVYRADVAEDFYQSYLWTPSIHMPRHASRITLEITGVRVERLQDITEADAMAEGFDGRNDFHDLWNKLNGKRGFGWDANPWVWVIEFERVKQ